MGERIRKIRLHAIFEGFKKGLTKSEDLIKQADIKEEIENRRWGKSSVKHFYDFATSINIIEKVTEPTETEDLKFGIDAWIHFKEGQKFTRLPVQIKSSKGFVDKFKNSDEFKRNGFVMVINANEKRKYSAMAVDFYSELKRLKNIADPQSS